MRRGVLTLVVLVGALVAPMLGADAAQASGPPKGCDARGAVYRKGSIRVFLRGSKLRRYSLCSAHFHTPHVYHERRIDPAEDVPYDFSVKGRRLFYQDFIVKTQTSVLAWVDLATADYRETLVPKRSIAYLDGQAVGATGGIAFVMTTIDRGQAIFYAAPGASTLTRPRVIVRIADGDVTPGSLWVGRALVHWKTASGPRRSAPLSGPARTVGTPLTCGSRARLYRRKAVRVFYRTVGGNERFYVCSGHLRSPKLFLIKNPWILPPLYGLQRFGPRLRFLVEWGGEDGGVGIGWVDLRTGHEADITPEGGFDDTVLGPDGAVAWRSGKRIYYAPIRSGQLRAARLLTTITNGKPANNSLAIRHRRVWWKTTTGEDGSVPVTGTN